jgi:cytochrome c553
MDTRAVAGSLSLVILVIFAAVLVLSPVMASSAPAAPAPSGGCATCHAAGKVATLDAALKKIRNHPQLPAPTLAMCAGCHKAGGAATPLGPALHKRHLAVAAFTGTYKGTCTSCHAVDARTGVITVIGLPPR